jgi:energy-coupling factor transporter ATP-binding protein EcfA2
MGATAFKQSTKWWKCDLQVATPAWRFELPVGNNFDFLDHKDQTRFADLYMKMVRARGVEVIALADHNSHEWIDLMCEAGNRNGVIVFPGCEVTTGTGADGVHLLIIGDRCRTSRDFDQLLAGEIGFDSDHPRFHDDSGQKVPSSSRKTLMQILDDLPDDFLVIAPHALNENGIASKKTAKGDIRWKALHHDRLNALDPGDCQAPDSNAWNMKFRRRELDHFPCLKNIAYVATSDAYALDKIGGRFSWLRMGEPTLEAMRQAFLDHEARIICNWDSRLPTYPNADPNEVRHGWIRSIHLGGILGNSRAPLTIPLHPGLNTIIGGRGSGKSTIVAAVRQLYADTTTLPDKIRDEADSFAATVFATAQLEAQHLLRNSQEQQTAVWSIASGALTRHDKGDVATTFKVRVVNQKELFERVARDKDDPFAASRSFLAFVDESLGFNRPATPAADSWWRQFEGACATWTAAMRSYQVLVTDLGQLPAVRTKVEELEGQLTAFDSPEATARRENIRLRRSERDALNEQVAAFEQWLDALPGAPHTAVGKAEIANAQSVATDADGLQRTLAELEQKIKHKFADLRQEAKDAVAAFSRQRDASPWWQDVQAAERDAEAYVAELQAKGIDPQAYNDLQKQLRGQQTLLKQLKAKEADREAAGQSVENAWNGVTEQLQKRLDERCRLLEEVGGRSGTLKFSVDARRDVIGWTDQVRNLLNLRSDAFLEDVPILAKWLWECDGDESATRWRAWREALASGNFVAIVGSAKLRPTWLKKLQTLDEALRLRLAVEVADDVVTMQFLRDGGVATRDEDWQVITEGSPGQRTAAMLGFVLHHGLEPLVLDQPEDDLDTEWISNLVVKELRASRWKRQIIVVTHNANIPVNGDADQVIVLENKDQVLRVRSSPDENGGEVCHCGPIEFRQVRNDIQNIMEGGITAFIRREKKYNNEMRLTRLNNSPA